MKIKKDKQKIISLVLVSIILVIGFCLRVCWLEKSPSSVNWDEAALGYNAYSILKTGADEYSQKFPITLRSFDDHKGAVYSYWSIPFIAVNGLNASSVRMVSVLAGTGLILLAFLIGKKLFNFRVGMGAMMAMAFSPMMILFSRTAFEANLALFWLMTGVYLILKEKNKGRLLLGYLFLVLSMYTYHTEKIVAPLVILISLIGVWKREGIKPALILSGLIALAAIPLAITLVWGGGVSRLTHTSIVKLWPFTPDYGFQNLITLPYYLVNELLGRLVAVFSPATLFVRGSSEPGQKLIETGILPLTLAIPWAVGWWRVIKENKKEIWGWMGIWLIVTLISWNWFSLVRSLPAIFWHCLVIGVGIDYLFTVNKKRLLVLIFAGMFLVEAIYTTNAVWMSLPAYQAGDYQPGMKQMVEEVMKIEKNYDRVIIDSPQAQPYIFTLFYSEFDPTEYQKLSQELTTEELKEHTRMGKFEFRRVDWTNDSKLPGLIVTNHINVSDQKVEEIREAELISKTLNNFRDEEYRLIEIK